MRGPFIFLVLSIFCLPAIAQTEKDNSIKLLFEKAYLHTDRDVYAQGDTLWFKAYLVNAQDNKPVNSSGTLYVELLTPDSPITAQLFTGNLLLKPMPMAKLP